jgi:hypothetical protein
MWEHESLLTEEIKSAQRRGGGACHSVQSLWDVAGNLKIVMSSLKRWSKEKFGAVTGKLEKIQKHMEELGCQDLGIDSNEMRELRQRMDGLIYREELIWMQHSCIIWLKEGDRNTKYFHCKATDRKRKILLSC